MTIRATTSGKNHHDHHSDHRLLSHRRSLLWFHNAFRTWHLRRTTILPLPAIAPVPTIPPVAAAPAAIHASHVRDPLPAWFISCSPTFHGRFDTSHSGSCPIPSTYHRSDWINFKGITPAHTPSVGVGCCSFSPSGSGSYFVNGHSRIPYPGALDLPFRLLLDNQTDDQTWTRTTTKSLDVLAAI